MGGDREPLEIQKCALYVKQHTKCKTAWYSGRDCIPDYFSIQSLDFIKLGPYIESLGGLDSPTTNQHFYKISADGNLEDWTYKFRKENKCFSNSYI